MQITLKAARVNAGLTQAKAAELLGITEKTLIDFEKSKRFPDVPMIKLMESLYHIEYHQILWLKSTV